MKLYLTYAYTVCRVQSVTSARHGFAMGGSVLMHMPVLAHLLMLCVLNVKEVGFKSFAACKI